MRNAWSTKPITSLDSFCVSNEMKGAVAGLPIGSFNPNAWEFIVPM